MSGKNGNGQYKTYRFHGQDPVIRILRDIIAIKQMRHTQISKACGVSAGTLGKWFGRSKKPTRYPQFRTVQAVARAVGKSFRIGNV